MLRLPSGRLPPWTKHRGEKLTLIPFGIHNEFRRPRTSRYLLFAGLALSAVAIACSGGGDDDETATPQPTTAAAPMATVTSLPEPATTPSSSVIQPTATSATVPAPTPTPRSAPAPTPRPTATRGPAATPPTATPIPPTPAPASTPVPTPTQDPFEGQFLAFDAPEFFDDVSEVPTYTIIGRSRIDAFVTINDQIVDVDENGRFTLDVQLEEGINIFEVVSSVSDSESLDEVLTVIYAP
jgi:hypothetical protein